MCGCVGVCFLRVCVCKVCWEYACVYVWCVNACTCVCVCVRSGVCLRETAFSFFSLLPLSLSLYICKHSPCFPIVAYGQTAVLPWFP